MLDQLTGDNIVAIVVALVAAVSGGAGAVWKWWVQPKQKRLTELERSQAETDKAQLEAKEARDKFNLFALERVTQAEKERDAAIARTEVAMTSNAILTEMVKGLTEVVRDGNRAVLEESRSIKATVEAIHRGLR